MAESPAKSCQNSSIEGLFGFQVQPSAIETIGKLILKTLEANRGAIFDLKTRKQTKPEIYTRRNIYLGVKVTDGRLSLLNKRPAKFSIRAKKVEHRAVSPSTAAKLTVASNNNIV